MPKSMILNSDTPWSIPKRFFKLTIEFAKNNNDKFELIGKKIEIGLNAKVSFNTTETVTGAVAEANITITGIKKETMCYLATSCSVWVKNPVLNRITIEAGYETSATQKTAWGLIFTGNIIEAIPNLSTADYSLQIKALSMYTESLNKIIPIEKKEKTNVLEILEEIRKSFSIRPYLDVKSLEKDYFIENYTKELSISQHFRYLSDITKLAIFFSNNTIYIVEMDKALKNVKPFEVSLQTGMIGSPEPHPRGCYVNIRLNSALKTGQGIIIKSLKFASLNGDDYILQTISHSGDTKGNQWLTRLTLIKKNIFGV